MENYEKLYKVRYESFHDNCELCLIWETGIFLRKIYFTSEKNVVTLKQRSETISRETWYEMVHSGSAFVDYSPDR